MFKVYLTIISLCISLQFFFTFWVSSMMSYVKIILLFLILVHSILVFLWRNKTVFTSFFFFLKYKQLLKWTIFYMFPSGHMQESISDTLLGMKFLEWYGINNCHTVWLSCYGKSVLSTCLCISWFPFINIWIF